MPATAKVTYLSGHISRFGAYATESSAATPGAFNPVLKEVDSTTPQPRRLNRSSGTTAH